jgi:hypothetical protein
VSEAVRAELEGLQRDAAVLRQDLKRLGDERRQAEAAAMAAVQKGDDAAARDALQREQRCAESASLLATELEMTELIIRGYVDVLAAIDLTDRESAPSGGRELVASSQERDDPMAELAEMNRVPKPPLPPSQRMQFPMGLRVLACSLGVAVAIGGLFLAAEAGEILVGAPVILFGGFAFASGLKGRVPRLFRRAVAERPER